MGEAILGTGPWPASFTVPGLSKQQKLIFLLRAGPPSRLYHPDSAISPTAQLEFSSVAAVLRLARHPLLETRARTHCLGNSAGCGNILENDSKSDNLAKAPTGLLVY